MVRLCCLLVMLLGAAAPCLAGQSPRAQALRVQGLKPVYSLRRSARLAE